MQINAPQMMNPALLGQVGAPSQTLALQQQMALQQQQLQQQQQQTLALAGPSASSQQAMMAATAVQPRHSIGTILKSMVLTAGLGAGIGAAATFIPGIPGGPLIGAAVGAAAGALLGLFRGVRKARSQRDEQAAMMMGSQNLPADPNALGPEMAVTPADAGPAAATAAAIAAPKPHKAKPMMHMVKAGDTLGSIAKMHHITISQLQAANHKMIGDNPNMIHIGSKLVIPRHKKK